MRGVRPSLIIVVQALFNRTDVIAIDDATEQIMRRLKLIDPILTFGFQRISEYLMSIYLSNVPPHVQRQKEISVKLLRKTQLQNGGQNLLLVDVKFIRNIITLNKHSRFSPSGP